MCLHPWQHPAKHGRENGGVGMGASRQTASLLLVLLLPAVPCSAWEKMQSSGLGVLALTADGDAIIAGSGNGPGPVSAARVAGARNASADQVKQLITQFTERADLGFLGEPRVNVPMLNIAIDQRFPISK